MPPLVGRIGETAALTEFLDICCVKPSGLLLEGEAGIGKSTLWLAGLEQARARGIRVLSARAAPSESVLAYVSFADLIAGVDAEIFAALAAPQRRAVDRILLQAGDNGAATDQRAVAAAFVSVIGKLAENSPVLVAIDDLQWIDPSSARVVAFAARRLSGPVGVLGTVRTGTHRDEMSWLQQQRLDMLQRIRLRPLSIGALRDIVAAQLGQSFPRATMLRIHETSGGNPFYALELARAMSQQGFDTDVTLPTTLTGLVGSKIGGLAADAREALLAAACLTTPTVELVARAVGVDEEQLVERIVEAEVQGVITIDGNRLRFSHPLLIAGVVSAAAPAQRRSMHRRLASLIGHPELQARHLALAAVRGDPVTLAALDAAAGSAAARGAPAAAAEFMGLAIRLGGDTPQRHISCAASHFDAGDPTRARTLLQDTIETLPRGLLRAQALSMLGLIALLNDSFVEAADLLERALADAERDLALRVSVLVSRSFALVNGGHFDAAIEAADDAVTDAETLGHRGPLGQALGMRTMLRFMNGDGLDQHSLDRALRLEEQTTGLSVSVQPRAQNALLLAWTGRLEPAGRELLAIRRKCLDEGAEGDLPFVYFHAALTEVWRGRLAEATCIADDAMEQAAAVGGDLPLAVASASRALVSAYAGAEDTARRDTATALAAFERCGSYRLWEWPITALGFLEVSLGNYDAAATVLEPLLSRLQAAPRGTEIIAAAFVPDAVEALISVGRLDDAEPLIDALQQNGRRLHRPWMLAVGARCRAMLLAGRRDLGGATTAAERAMTEHDGLPMPFERARTQLLLGDLQRRQRSRETAAATLRAAATTFEELNTPLWAARARDSLDRIHFGPTDTRDVLTTAERRIAELVAAGKTNNDVAAALFVSVKTVEVHLSRIYRKLDIRSRAELARRLDHLDDRDGS
jgi:DNA-binding CsgD family transcriptional regulator/tetratricopeptide (TPR) repeat protein